MVAAILFSLSRLVLRRVLIWCCTCISTLLLSWWRLHGFLWFAPKVIKRAILIADGDEAVELVDEINNNDRYDYGSEIIDNKLLQADDRVASKLLQLVERERISIIIADVDNSASDVVATVLFNLSFLEFSCTFIDFTSLYEDTFDKVPVSKLSQRWFIAHVSKQVSPVYDVVKRVIDIVGAIGLLVVVSPLLPVVAALIKLEDGGPVLYSTVQVGQHNNPITIYKFRTKNGSDTADQALKSQLVDTKLGGVLRASRIDELPQLINVLREPLIGLVQRCRHWPVCMQSVCHTTIQGIM